MHRLTLLACIMSLVGSVHAENLNSITTIPDIAVVDEKVGVGIQKDDFLVMQETTPGMKQPVINGLMGDKVLITLDHNKFTNALFRSGPNQYYSWVPDQFVLKNSVNETLLNSSLGGTVDRTIGIDTTGVDIDASYNTFTGLATFNNKTVQVGTLWTSNGNVVTPHDGEVKHSGYNQKAIYTGVESNYGTTKFMFTQSDDVDRTDKFEKGDYYVYELQRYIMFSHQYRIDGSNIVIMPSWQQFKEKIDRDSPEKKNVDSQNDIFGLMISDQREGILSENDLLKYGIMDHYEDISYTKGSNTNHYTYNTFSLWASYHAFFSENWDYKMTYNFSYLNVKGGGIDRNMAGNAAGISVNYYINGSWLAYASCNSNFKFPTITNLAEARSDSVEEVPNPDLDSEKAITSRIGIVYKDLEVSLFYKKLYDMIIREQTSIPDGEGGYKWKYENTDEGYIKGFSLTYDTRLGDVWKIHFNVEILDGKTDYDYISKLQPVATSAVIKYKNFWCEYLYAPSVPEDKMALKDKTDIRIKGHNYGYSILNMGYDLQYEHHTFGLYLDNAFNDRGRVYGSSVDFNERRLRFKYSYHM